MCKLRLTQEIIEWIKFYFKDNPDGKAIIGISGGKDSTICAKLLVEALGKDRVIGVLMPNHFQHDIEDSVNVCNLLGINYRQVNIGNAYNQLVWDIVGVDPVNEVIRTNLPSRLRMATLYAVAALYPNSRVVNTSNFSERYVGYSTKFGDGVGDFSPLGGLLVSEVLAVGDDLGLPYGLVHKAPADGMSGKTDEDNLGFTYADLDQYLIELLNGEPCSLPDDIRDKIIARNKANIHKLAAMPRFVPEQALLDEIRMKEVTDNA